MSESKKRLRVPALKEKKVRGEKITVLTAYDYAMAGLLDRAGIDVQARHGVVIGRKHGDFLTAHLLLFEGGNTNPLLRLAHVPSKSFSSWVAWAFDRPFLRANWTVC